MPSAEAAGSAESRCLSLRFLRLPLQEDHGADKEEVITPPGF